jgi:hypothetical protein
VRRVVVVPSHACSARTLGLHFPLPATTVAAGPRKTRTRVPDRRENEKTAYAQKPRSI